MSAKYNDTQKRGILDASLPPVGYVLAFANVAAHYSSLQRGGVRDRVQGAVAAELYIHLAGTTF